MTTKQKIIEASRNWSNFERMKKNEDILALKRYGFSNTGELKEIKKVERIPLSAGAVNLCRQFLP